MIAYVSFRAKSINYIILALSKPCRQIIISYLPFGIYITVFTDDKFLAVVVAKTTVYQFDVVIIAMITPTPPAILSSRPSSTSSSISPSSSSSSSPSTSPLPSPHHCHQQARKQTIVYEPGSCPTPRPS